MRIYHRPAGALAGIAIAAALAFGLTACGSDDSSSSSTAAAADTTASAGTDAGLAAAKANVDAHTKDPTSIGPTEPIGKPIPKDKLIVYVNCGAQACTNMGASLKDATGVLGWKYKEIAAQPTPEAIQAAFQEAARLKPDGVASAGFSTTSYQRQLKELVDGGATVLSDTGTDPVGDGLSLQLQSDVTHKGMELAADKVIVDSGGKANIANVVLTGYPIVEQYSKDFAAEIAKNCSGCTVKDLSIQPTSIGKDSASLIANFLRANPEIDSVFLGYDDLANGLPAAVKGAGVKMPKTYSWAPTQTGIAALQSGERTAAVPQDTQTVGWQFADAFARAFTGGDVAEDQKWEEFVLWSKEYGNLPESTDNPPVIANYQEQFKKNWGLAK